MSASRIPVLWRGAVRRGRSVAYSFGNDVECPFCGWTGRRFLPAGVRNTPNRKCPGCGSLERYRLLHLLLEETGLLRRPGVRVLDIAPKPCFAAYCRALPEARYVSADLASAGADVLTDLTLPGLRGEAFDVIVCFHVLEHIPGDVQAMQEMRRLLRPDGVALIQVPLRGRHTEDGPDLPVAERMRRFGQCDHVRMYGDDIVDRLAAAGFDAQLDPVLDRLPRPFVGRHALNGDDRVIIVARPAPRR